MVVVLNKKNDYYINEASMWILLYGKNAAKEKVMKKIFFYLENSDDEKYYRYRKILKEIKKY